jgi:CheY-like chemotaxis protein
VPRLDRREMVQQAVRLLSETTLSSLGRGVGTPSARATRQILVIDDSQTFRGILRRTFEKAYPGDIVREAEDGRQALSQMTHQKVDLIVTDLEMPGMNGMTFLKHMKGNPILSKKPVLILSGTLSEELRIHAARMPNVRFLNKPARPERIIMELSLLGYD